MAGCISNLQLQSVDLAVTQLFCSRAELRIAWLELRARRALQPVKLLSQLLKALGVPRYYLGSRSKVKVSRNTHMARR